MSFESLNDNLYNRSEDTCFSELEWFVMLKIEYSRHALMRIKLRSIGKNEVERVLLSPREVYFDVVTSNMIAIGERLSRHGHWLIVVYTKSNDVYRIVTVIDVKSLNKIVQRRIRSGRWVRIW
jgi:hypothetical protein